ncbi:15588_t:CDS:1 [Acaulospora morrowiae]|uniref:15588_t:CDS:1 n=1 Tax=Acaulospora morrowiae TaxID=94023 RepID=A0A9N9BC42_9GLOM|nr:15588_t:CDS:1 [Acaulospora morrowiae]
MKLKFVVNLRFLSSLLILLLSTSVKCESVEDQPSHSDSLFPLLSSYREDSFPFHDTFGSSSPHQTIHSNPFALMDELLDFSMDATKEMFDSLNDDLSMMGDDEENSSITTIEITIVGGPPAEQEESNDDDLEQYMGTKNGALENDDEQTITTIPFPSSFDKPILCDTTQQEDPLPDEKTSFVGPMSAVLLALAALAAVTPVAIKLLKCRKKKKSYEYLIVHANDEDQVTDLERAVHDKK